MALKIRLRQQGKTNRIMYRLVVAEARASRDGRYVEMLGWYNPHAEEDKDKIHITSERVAHWLNLGAQLTDTATALLKRVAPEIIKAQVAKKVEKKAKALAKTKKEKAS